MRIALVFIGYRCIAFTMVKAVGHQEQQHKEPGTGGAEEAHAWLRSQLMLSKCTSGWT